MTIYFPLIHTNTHNLQGQGPVQVRLILCASLFVPASAGSVGSLARHSTARRYHSSTCPTSSAKRRSRRSKCSLRLALAAAKCRREPTCFGTSQEAGPHGRVPLPLSGGGQPTHRNELALLPLRAGVNEADHRLVAWRVVGELALSPGCQVVRCCQELSGGCQAAVRRCQDNSCQAVVRSVRLRGRASTSRPVRRCQACQVCQLSGAVRPVRRCQAVRPVRTRLGHNHLTTSTQIITTPLMDTPTLHPHEFFVHHLFLYINSSWRFRSAIATPPAASGGDTL